MIADWGLRNADWKCRDRSAHADLFVQVAGLVALLAYADLLAKALWEFELNHFTRS